MVCGKFVFLLMGLLSGDLYEIFPPPDHHGCARLPPWSSSVFVPATSTPPRLFKTP